MTRATPTLLVLLAGCPYVFGPPDLSNVSTGKTPVTDGEVDSDADSDADSDIDTETGTVPTEPGDPVIVFLEVVPRMTQVVVHFSIADGDEDVLGGSIEVSDGTASWVLGIPGQMDVWDPLGVSTVALPIASIPGTDSWLDCNTPVHQTWTVTPTDLAGHVGQVVEAPLDLPTLGLLPEVGVPGDVDLWPIDQHTTTLSPPFMGCVTFEIDPADTEGTQQQLRRDFEGVGFTTVSPGAYVAQVQWDGANACDIDLYAYWYPTIDQMPADGIADTSDLSAQGGPVPEQITWQAAVGEGWLVDFPFYQMLPGGAPPFQAQFLITPK